MAKENINKGLNDALKEVILGLSKALIEQGHKSTGSLIQSFASKIEATPIGIDGVVTMNDYGIFVDSGRNPGAKKVPIDALMKWIVINGISSPDRSTRQLAFAIQNSIFKEGIPSRNSLSLSRTGKRTGFLAEGLDKALDRIDDIMAIALEKEVDKELKAFVDTTNQS